jgi:heptosyltransferase II
MNMVRVDPAESRPILVVPYMWIGDFVRCHSVVQLLKSRWPDRPVDVLATTLCAPLVDYMPGVRRAVSWDLPRKRLAFGRHAALADRLRAEDYGTALIMPRTWKSALAPYLAGIPQRIGFFGEARVGLLSEIRFGERALPRMIERCASLALPRGADFPTQWPRPRLEVSPTKIRDFTLLHGLDQGGDAIALAPGAVGPSKRWPVASYTNVATDLIRRGYGVWVLGGPEEASLAAEIARGAGPRVRDLTGPHLRDAILALAAAKAAVSNDSGLLHVAAALGTPTVGIFGPTSPWHWAPLNPLAATIETPTQLSCRPCHKPTCRPGHHRCMHEIGDALVREATLRAVSPVFADNDLNISQVAKIGRAK